MYVCVCVHVCKCIYIYIYIHVLFGQAEQAHRVVRHGVVLPVKDVRLRLLAPREVHARSERRHVEEPLL